MIRLLIAALLVAVTTAARAQAPSGIDALLRAYPEQLATIDGNALVWRDGTRMAIADGLPPRVFRTCCGTDRSSTRCASIIPMHRISRP